MKLTGHTGQHTKEQPFICQLCTKSFTTKINLKTHVQYHTELKTFACQLCKRLFKQQGHLETHIRTHTLEKPYMCKFCHKSFSQSSPLELHRKLHSASKLFPCDTRRLRFATKIDRIKYMTRNIGCRNYKCIFCSKRFLRFRGLQYHIRVHTGEKRNSCLDCGKTFLDLTQVSSHRLIQERSHFHVFSALEIFPFRGLASPHSESYRRKALDSRAGKIESKYLRKISNNLF